MDTRNTAQLRELAAVAASGLRWEEAAEFYALAADRYPASSGALAAVDVSRLRERAEECRFMVGR